MFAVSFADLELACSPGQSKIKPSNQPATSPPTLKAFPHIPDFSSHRSVSQNADRPTSASKERESGELMGLGISLVSLAEATAPPPLALPESLSFANPNSLPQSMGEIHKSSPKHLASPLSEAEVAYASVSSFSSVSLNLPKKDRDEVVDITDNGIRWNIEAFDVGNLLGGADTNGSAREVFTMGRSLPFAIEEEPEEPETSESMYSTSSAPRSRLTSRLTFGSRSKIASSSGPDIPHPVNGTKSERGKTFKNRMRQMFFKRAESRN